MKMFCYGFTFDQSNYQLQVIFVRNCICAKSGTPKPFVAKVASIWQENGTSICLQWSQHFDVSCIMFITYARFLYTSIVTFSFCLHPLL